MFCRFVMLLNWIFKDTGNHRTKDQSRIPTSVSLFHKTRTTTAVSSIACTLFIKQISANTSEAFTRVTRLTHHVFERSNRLHGRHFKHSSSAERTGYFSYDNSAEAHIAEIQTAGYSIHHNLDAWVSPNKLL